MPAPEALRQALGQVIADLRREWRRELELLEAQSRQTVAELRAQIAEFQSELRARVDARLAELKDGEPGRSIGVDDVSPLIAEAVDRAVEALPRPRDGESVTVEQLAPLVDDVVGRRLAELPPQGGNAAIDAEDVAALIEREVARVVSALPPAPAGKDADPEEIERLVAAHVEDAVARLPAPAPGRDGAPGKLPLVEEWTDRVHLESEVVAHEGSTWQALRHTGKAPPHEDWRCIARAGRDGAAGRGINVRSTWSAAETYAANDLVALDGGSFVARRDDPGPCPGEGWQLVAMRGKPGKPGEKGDKGDTVKGDRGPPGPGVAALSIDETGLVVLTNGDGTTVERDFSPVLSRLGH